MIGIGLNTHGQLLPVPAMRAIGIQWVRGDNNKATPKDLQIWKNHYSGFDWYWTLPMDSTAPDVARQLVKIGIRDIGCGNEPNGEWSFPSGIPWTADQYAAWFKTIRKAVGRTARLCGPASDRDYAKACQIAGADFDKIDIHSYWIKPEDTAASLRWTQTLTRRPAFVGEISFPTDLGVPYPIGGDPVGGFFAMKNCMGSFPWCYYDGPNDNIDKAIGLFDSNDGKFSWTVPTATYNKILAQIQAARNVTA